jgi:hypothetical protein
MQAADLAAEDTILALDKALQAGISGLTVDMYLKHVSQVLPCTSTRMYLYKDIRVLQLMPAKGCMAGCRTSWPAWSPWKLLPI